MSVNKLLYVFTQAPYSNAAGQEALDALLIGAAFEQDVSVLFIHNGVFQLKNEQVVSAQRKDSGFDGRLKQYTKTFKALGDFGVDNIYIDQLSLLSRGITPDELMIDVKALESEQVRELINEQFRVFTF